MIKAKNDVLQLNGDTMHYIRFGGGTKTLVMLPGLGDGLTTVRGKALPMAGNAELITLLARSMNQVPVQGTVPFNIIEP